MNQPFAFIMKNSFSTIQPNEIKTMKFAFGYVPTNQSLETLLAPFQGNSNSPYQETKKQWKKQSASFQVSKKADLTNKKR